MLNVGSCPRHCITKKDLPKIVSGIDHSPDIMSGSEEDKELNVVTKNKA